MDINKCRQIRVASDALSMFHINIASAKVGGAVDIEIDESISVLPRISVADEMNIDADLKRLLNEELLQKHGYDEIAYEMNNVHIGRTGKTLYISPVTAKKYNVQAVINSKPLTFGQERCIDSRMAFNFSIRHPESVIRFNNLV